MALRFCLQQLPRPTPLGGTCRMGPSATLALLRNLRCVSSGAEVTTTSDPVAEFLARVEARPAGPGKWTARCPAHEDSHASLSIARGETGALLLRCFAGCEFKQILAAAGMQPGDAFPTKTNGNGRRNPERPMQRFTSPADAAAAVARGKGGEVERLYRWSDGWYRARIKLSAGKLFMEITQDGDGWILRGPGKPHCLYRVNDLPRTGPVYVVEGEKAAEAGWRVGIPCTTSGGASSAGSADWTPLAGRDVVVLPDNDTPGLKYAIAVRDALAALNPPARVKVLQLPGLPDGGDLVEFIDERDGHDADEVRGEIVALVGKVKVEGSAAQKVVSRYLSDVRPRGVEWLWPLHIPRRAITLIGGNPEMGKSLVTLDLAARITTGRPWPLSEHAPDVGTVILVVGGEDDIETVIRPRFDAAGGDPSKLRTVEGIRGDDGRVFQFSTRKDAARLQGIIEDTAGCSMVILDPLSTFMAGVDTHKHADTYAALSPLAAVAQATGVAIVGVAHAGKGRNESGIALQKLMGSVAFGAIARSIWTVFDDPEDVTGDGRLLACAKASLCRQQPALSYSIQQDQYGLPFVNWTGHVEKSANDLQRELNAAGTGDSGGALKEAVEFLRSNLDTNPKPAADLISLAEEQGISKRTLARARAKLGVKTRQERDGQRVGGWLWWMPYREEVTQ